MTEYTATTNQSTAYAELTLLPGRLSAGDLAEVLFCSSLQPSQPADAAAVTEAVAQSLRSHHNLVSECAEELAASYGKDPEVTCLRMRWARRLVAETYPAAAAS